MRQPDYDNGSDGDGESDGDSDANLTSIEDLDAPPEPAGRGGLTFRRELLLGLVLIVGLSVWVGWQWWHQEADQNNYDLGRQAASAHDWDLARTYFQAAPGFKDADALAVQAGKLIQERNSQYIRALDGVKRADWLTVLQATAAVEQIEPGYPYIDSIHDGANEQALSAALSGSVAMRAQAQPPGLYYRDSTAWFWLQGSDRLSRVLGIGSPDHIVYDVPGPGATGLGGRQSPGYNLAQSGTLATGSPDLRGRALMVATYSGGKLMFTRLALDPSRYNFYIWGERGVWALRANGGYIPGWQITPGRAFLTTYLGYDMDYQEFDRSVARVLTLPGPGWAVIDLGRDGQHVLLGQVSDITGFEEITSLYVAAGDGQSPRLLYKGGVLSAQLSPDGRYALANVYETLGGAHSEQQSTLLFDLRDMSAGVTSRALGGKTVPGMDHEREMLRNLYPDLGASFLMDGPLSGMVLLADWGLNDSKLTLLDPEHPSGTLSAVEVGSSPVRGTWIAYDPTGGVVLAWQDGIGAAVPYAPRMTVVTLNPGAPGATGNVPSSSVSRVPLPDHDALTGLRVVDGYLVYTTQPYVLDVEQPRFTTARVIQLGDDGLRPSSNRDLYSEPLRNLWPFSVEMPWIVGPRLMGYVSGGHLHVRAYDGSGDLQLQSDVVRLFDFSDESIRSPR